MSRNLLMVCLLGAGVLVAAEPDDLLRFTNGDQLHGTFQGINETGGVLWKRADVATAVDFKPSQLRHLVFRGGRPARLLSSLSSISLVNGDQVPGVVTAMDGETLTLDTRYGGKLEIPRAQVAMLAPSPLGGRLHYHGPFNEDEWKMAHASFPDGIPPASELPDKQQAADDSLGRWVFSGSAWHWPGKQSGTALLRESGMPDCSILRFDLAWKNRLSIALGFHADWKKAKPTAAADEDAKALPGRAMGFAPGDSGIFPVVFGNSYVLQIFSTHMMLFKSTVDDEGLPKVERVQLNGNSIRLGDTGKATMELRSSRATGEIILFVNGELVVRWSDGGLAPGGQKEFAGKGNGFGFVVQTEDSPVKISDVIVGEWNGLPDSARSLQGADQDVVLLANGMDRFSGKIGDFREGKLRLASKYGQFDFALEDLAEVRFASIRLLQAKSPAADQITLRLSPLGKISGRLLAGDATSIRLLNPVCGEISLNLESAVMLDFANSNKITDEWDLEN